MANISNAIHTEGYVELRKELEHLLMTDLLLAQGASLERKEVSEKAYVARKENQGNAGGNNGGGNDDNNTEIG